MKNIKYKILKKTIYSEIKNPLMIECVAAARRGKFSETAEMIQDRVFVIRKKLLSELAEDDKKGSARKAVALPITDFKAS